MAASVKVTPKVTPEQKAQLLMAASQMGMMAQAFGEAPERVKKAAEELQSALEEWANNA